MTARKALIQIDGQLMELPEGDTLTGAVVAGDKMFMTTYTDGAAKINYLYTLGHTRPELTRWLVI